MTFVVGSEVHQESKNDFTQIGKPFLMGTVALGKKEDILFFYLFIYYSANCGGTERSLYVLIGMRAVWRFSNPGA